MDYIKRLSALIFLCFLSAGIYFIYWSSNVSKVEIVFTTDGHGHILPSRAHWEDDGRFIGGLSALGGFLETIKEPYLLTDSGDIYQGTPEGFLTRGTAIVEIMNVLGYDTLAVGNHDFDHGRENLISLSSIADFPFLGANIIDAATGQEPDFISPGFIKNINDINIGIAGVITEDMENLVFSEHIKGLEFISASESLESEIRRLKDEGAHIIVVLSHMGLEDDMQLARTREIDAILGGHTHRLLKEPQIAGRTLITQAGSNFTHAGRLSLYYSRPAGRILSFSHALVPLYVDKYGQYDAVEKIIDNRLADVVSEMSRIIGQSEIRMSRSLTGEAAQHGELAIGNFQADIMRAVAGADIAFQNTGGIRADIPKGDITVRDIWNLSPFGNSIITMNLSGMQLKELLELSAAHRYSRLQISGLRMIYNSSLPRGRRVLNVFVMTDEGEETLDLEEKYKVATNSFLAQGGDGYSTFRNGEDVTDTSILLREAQIEYIEKNSPVTASCSERIVNVSIE